MRCDEEMGRPTTIPGVGPISTASIKALVADPKGFASGLHFAAWLGLNTEAVFKRQQGAARRDIEDGAIQYSEHS